MTKRAVYEQSSLVRVDWKSSIEKLSVGDKLIVRGVPQTSVGAALAGYNNGVKRFVSKKVPDGVQVIRIAE